MPDPLTTVALDWETKPSAPPLGATYSELTIAEAQQAMQGFKAKYPRFIDYMTSMSTPMTASSLAAESKIVKALQEVAKNAGLAIGMRFFSLPRSDDTRVEDAWSRYTPEMIRVPRGLLSFSRLYARSFTTAHLSSAIALNYDGGSESEPASLAEMSARNWGLADVPPEYRTYGKDGVPIGGLRFDRKYDGYDHRTIAVFRIKEFYEPRLKDAVHPSMRRYGATPFTPWTGEEGDIKDWMVTPGYLIAEAWADRLTRPPQPEQYRRCVDVAYLRGEKEIDV